MLNQHRLPGRTPVALSGDTLTAEAVVSDYDAYLSTLEWMSDHPGNLLDEVGGTGGTEHGEVGACDGLFPGGGNYAARFKGPTEEDALWLQAYSGTGFPVLTMNAANVSSQVLEYMASMWVRPPAGTLYNRLMSTDDTDGGIYLALEFVGTGLKVEIVNPGEYPDISVGFPAAFTANEYNHVFVAFSSYGMWLGMNGTIEWTAFGRNLNGDAALSKDGVCIGAAYDNAEVPRFSEYGIFDLCELVTWRGYAMGSGDGAKVQALVDALYNDGNGATYDGSDWVESLG